MSVVHTLLMQRHRFYRDLLIVEVLALISLRPLQHAPQLVSLVYLLISGVAVLMDSPLLPRNRLTHDLGASAIPARQHPQLQRVLQRRRLLKNGWLLAAGVELLWQTSLLLAPALAVQLSVLHVVVWLALMLDPSAFQLPASRAEHLEHLPVAIAQAPQMIGAAFGSLTTLGSSVLRGQNLTSVSASVAITIVGQLYVAILIAGVLGKPRQLSAVRKAAHPMRRRPAPSLRLRRTRR